MTDDIRYYDMIVFGAGVAGLFLANKLKRAGYNVLVIEKDTIGGMQTLASQGMIHGGQKYTLQGKVTGHAANIADMPRRWEASFDGYGEVDLTGVKFLSDTQIMWPAGSVLSDVAVLGAAKVVNTQTRKLKREEFPDVFLERKKKFKGSVYELLEKVLEIRSLLEALAAPLKGRILKGEVSEILPDGQAAVNGIVMQAQLLIFTAGIGNETAFDMLRIKEQYAQRRPLRQVMVRPVPYALYGHGIVGKPKPRLTVTSHPNGRDGYVWYIGGNLAEEGARMGDDETLQFAKKELQDVFPDIDWDDKEWATWEGDRAEPYDPKGDLPPGPFVQQRGKVLMCWPAKLTFAPALADHVFDWMQDKDITPTATDKPPAELAPAEIGAYPWEKARWRKVIS